MTHPATLIVLAQTGGVAALPRPPLAAHYVLEQPWPLAGGLVALGLLTAWILNQRARARSGAIAGSVLVLLGAAVALTGFFITTTREALVARTTDLIATTARADISGLDPLLAKDVTLRLFTQQRRYSRDELIGLVRRYPGELYPVESHREEQATASIDGPNAARTQVRVVTRSAAATLYDLPVGSWWRVIWRRDPDGEWRVMGLECMQIDGVPSTSQVSP